MNRRQHTRVKPVKQQRDLKQDVTDRIIQAIEEGRMSSANLWARDAAGGLPINYGTRQPYSGANVLLLWLEAHNRGFRRNEWMTYVQAQSIGAQVRRGAKSCTLVRFNQIERIDDETGEIEFYPAPVAFSVFNVEEIDGIAPAATYAPFDAVETAERIMLRSGATIRETGDRAFYRVSTDECYLPDRSRFASSANFYHVAMHEVVHSTAHPSRLDREFGARFGDEAYAFEELVAELGAAFLLARIGIAEGQLEYHASYLDAWLRVLKRDRNAIFTAAGQASKAFSHLMHKAGLNEAVCASLPMAA